MSTFNGFGTTLYGRTSPVGDTYVTTEWIVAFFFPVVPLRSLRVRYVRRSWWDGTRTYDVIGEIPLSENRQQINRTRLWTLGPLLLLFAIGPIITLVESHRPELLHAKTVASKVGATKVAPVPTAPTKPKTPAEVQAANRAAGVPESFDVDNAKLLLAGNKAYFRGVVRWETTPQGEEFWRAEELRLTGSEGLSLEARRIIEAWISQLNSSR